MTMGQRIAQLRKTKGLSQEELAELVGVSRQAVSKWELDEAQPEASKIILLAQALGVTTDQLLLGEEADQQPTGEPPDRHPSPTPPAPTNALGRFIKAPPLCPYGSRKPGCGPPGRAGKSRNWWLQNRSAEPS